MLVPVLVDAQLFAVDCRLHETKGLLQVLDLGLWDLEIADAADVDFAKGDEGCLGAKVVEVSPRVPQGEFSHLIDALLV